MNPLIIGSHTVQQFEYNMISHSHNDFFYPLTINEIENSPFSELNYFVPISCKSLQDVLLLEPLSLNKIKQFMSQFIQLRDYCDEHLLDFDKVDFHPSNIYFDEISLRLKWRYVPSTKVILFFSLGDLLNRMFIESSLNKSLTLESMVNIENRLEIFLNDLSITPIQNSALKSPDIKKTWLRHLFNRHKSSKSKPQKTNSHSLEKLAHELRKTHQIGQYPMLIDKLNPTQHYKLYYDTTIIGRDETSTIVVSDISISKKHAILVKRNHQIFLSDCHSTNGILLNNYKIECETILSNGDNIQIGNKHFIFVR